MLALSQMTDFDKRSSNSSCSSSSLLTPLFNNPSSNAMPLVDNARPWIPALQQQQYTAGYYPSFQQPQQHEYYNCPFTASQWAELEQQALIFRYMMAKAPVPAELVNPIRRRLLNGPQNLLGGFNPGLGYSPLDLEPGRCRRTDGKKWRCARPIVPEQKYCERHVNRGRNRSKKAKEAAAAAAAAAAAKKPSRSCTPDHGSLKLISQHHLLFQSSSDEQSRFMEPASPKPTTSPLRQFFDDQQRPATKNADKASSPLDLSLLDATTRIGLASSQPPPPSPAPLPDDDDKRHLVTGAASSPTAVLQRAACTSDCSSRGSSPTASASVK